MSNTHNVSANVYNYDVAAFEEDELLPHNYPSPVKYERYDKKAFLNNKRQVKPQMAYNSKKTLKSQSKLDSKSCNRITNFKSTKYKKDYADSIKCRIESRRDISNNIKLSTNSYNDHSHTSILPKSMANAKKTIFGIHKDSSTSSIGLDAGRRKRNDRRPLNFRSIDRNTPISSTKSSVRSSIAKMPKSNSNLKKNVSSKAERMKKKSIAYLCRTYPRRYRIIAFAQEVAAKKIQRFYRIYKAEKVERQQIALDRALRRVRINYARAVIRKYTAIYLRKKIAFRQAIAFHSKYNTKSILLIQRKFRQMRSCSKPINVKRFKQVFSAVLLGWKVRRILGYIKSLPEMREAIDFI